MGMLRIDRTMDKDGDHVQDRSNDKVKVNVKDRKQNDKVHKKFGEHVTESLMQVLEHRMTASELKEYREAFAIFDKDGDGVITTKEVITVLRSLGQDPSHEMAQKMINIFDDNGNGKIEFSEFLLLIDRLADITEDDEELAEIFKVIDIDGDGEISKTDLRRTAYRLGSTLQMRELAEMIDEFDKDGDGLIDFEAG